MGDEIIYIVILLVYLAGMLVIGFISSKKVTNSKSYYTSDRNVSAAVTGFSYSSTQLSSGSTIGMPATVYTQGYSYMGTPMAAAAAPWFTFLLTGERVRKISERVDAIDYGDIFRARFGNASKILYELLIIVFAIPTIISQFAAAGSSVQSLTGISYNVAIPMIAVVLTIYTMSGGMNSVALTDYIQGIIMIAGFGILAAILLTRAGGFTAMHEGIAATDPDLLRLTGKASKTWVICCIITWSILMVGGSITSVVRFLIPKDLKALRGALGYSVFFNIFVLSACGVIGLCGITLLPGLESTDRLVPTPPCYCARRPRRDCISDISIPTPPRSSSCAWGGLSRWWWRPWLWSWRSSPLRPSSGWWPSPSTPGRAHLLFRFSSPCGPLGPPRRQDSAQWRRVLLRPWPGTRRAISCTTAFPTGPSASGPAFLAASFL